MTRVTKFFAGLTLENLIVLGTILAGLSVYAARVEAKAAAVEVRIIATEKRADEVSVKLDTISGQLGDARADVKVLRALAERVADKGKS